MFRVKRTSSCAVLLLLCTVLVLSGTTNETKKNSSTCGLQCKVSPGKTETKCTLTADPLKMNCSRKVYSNILQNVTSLDLSNLSNYLDVTANDHWIPSEQLLQLTNLATVQGVTLSKYCKNCLLKNKSDAAELYSRSQWCYRYGRLSLPSEWKWHDEIQYGKALDLIKRGFWPMCLCNDACYIHQNSLPYLQAIFDVTIKASYSLYATGLVALLMNITVVLVILCHKSLRGNLAVRLVLNIALCDILVGLVSLLFARYSYATMHIESLHDEPEGKSLLFDVFSKIRTSRNIMGPILTCAVVSQVFGSFILTLEKFLKIVFALKPDIRIGKCGVMLFLFVSWSFSLTFAVLPVFYVGRMSYNLDTAPLPTDDHEFTYLGDGEFKPTVGIAAGSQIVLIIIQLISFVLYLPIFIVSKRSGASVGIKREAAIARKIALLVFTNLIFFTAPVVIVIIIGVYKFQLWDHSRDMWQNWQDQTLTEFQWFTFATYILPILCVSINSVLNPFLYALRHPKIKQQLNTILCRCRNVLSECFAALRLHLPCCHSNAVQPGNDIEMN